MLTTLMTGLMAFTLLFFGLFLARYGVSQLRHAAEVRAAPAPVG